MSEAEALGKIWGTRLAEKHARKRFARDRASYIRRHQADPGLVWKLDGKPVPFEEILKFLEESERQFFERVAKEDALHASAPPGYKCADCQIDGAPCPECSRAYIQQRR